MKRWRSLRDRYQRERVKEKEAQRSGAGADKQPVWRYMAVMGFLAPFLQDSGTTSNLQHRNPSPVSVVAVTEEHGGGSHEEAGPLSPPALSAAMADEAATAPAADGGPVGRSQWRGPQKRAGVGSDIGLRCPLLSRASFMSLLPAMRRLSSPSRAMVRYEVYQIVSRADMAALQNREVREVRENDSE